MVLSLGPSADTRPVREPQAATLRLSLWHLQALTAPEALDPFVIHLPAFPLQHGRDPPVAVSPVEQSQLGHACHQRCFVIRGPGSIALRGSGLAQHPTGPALRDRQLPADMRDRPAPPGRAQ